MSSRPAELASKRDREKPATMSMSLQQGNTATRATVIAGYLCVENAVAGEASRRTCFSERTTGLPKPIARIASLSQDGGRTYDIYALPAGVGPEILLDDALGSDFGQIAVGSPDEEMLAAVASASNGRQPFPQDLSEALQLVTKAWAAKPGGPRYALDVATVIEHNLYADGWLENGPLTQMFMLSSDYSVLVRPSHVFFKPRSDVTALIERSGGTVHTPNHGFFIAGPVPLASEDAALGIYVMSGEECRRVGAFRFDKPAAKSALLSRLWEALEAKPLPDPGFAKSYIAPLLATDALPGRAHTAATVHAGTLPPRLSIIVPLYGEAFFIRSLLAMQQLVPRDYEWVLVCDDNRIARIVADVIASRTSFLSCRTKLVLNHGNYGYAASNNIGAANATADTLLFMNSDIWTRSADPLERAMAALHDGSWSLLGFQLAFEDGTVQHREMAFNRTPDYANLYLADHPGKGLPPPARQPSEIYSALAVTGALFMTLKSTYERLGGFNEAYVRGDFEDAALCLWLRLEGGTVGVVPTADIFHLERQSIRAMGSTTLRSIVTFCNCVTFNEHWAEFLDDLKARPASDWQAA